jgi:hypothetical protein
MNIDHALAVITTSLTHFRFDGPNFVIEIEVPSSMTSLETPENAAVFVSLRDSLRALRIHHKIRLMQWKDVLSKALEQSVHTSSEHQTSSVAVGERGVSAALEWVSRAQDRMIDIERRCKGVSEKRRRTGEAANVLEAAPST